MWPNSIFGRLKKLKNINFVFAYRFWDMKKNWYPFWINLFEDELILKKKFTHELIWSKIKPVNLYYVIVLRHTPSNQQNYHEKNFQFFYEIFNRNDWKYDWWCFWNILYTFPSIFVTKNDISLVFFEPAL